MAHIRLPVLSSCAQNSDKCDQKDATLPSSCIYEASFSCLKSQVSCMERDSKTAAETTTCILHTNSNEYDLGRFITFKQQIYTNENIRGDSLYISFKGHDYLYQCGKLYLQGILQTGKIKGFLRHTLTAFEKINEGKEGASMISELENSRNIFMIIDGYGHFKTEDIRKAYANQIETDSSQMSVLVSVQRMKTNIKGGSGGIIYWSPAGTIMPTAYGGVNSPTLDLAHEMFHGLDANRGLLDSRLHRGLARSEWQTVFRENLLRSQLNLPLRTHYGWNVDVEGNFVGGTGRSMVSINNLPIIPFWYKL